MDCSLFLFYTTMLLDKVKNNLLRMTSSRISGEVSNHPHFLNIPPMLARAEAAYTAAIARADQEKLMEQKDGKRALIYRQAESLLADACDLLHEVSGCAAIAKWEVDLEPVISFFTILKQELALLALLAETQAGTAKTANQWNNLSSTLHEQDLFFSETELKMLHFLKSTIKENEKFFLKFREFHKRMFSKHDADRYEQALRIFTESFREPL